MQRLEAYMSAVERWSLGMDADLAAAGDACEGCSVDRGRSICYDNLMSKKSPHPSIAFFKNRAKELEGEECHSHKLHTIALRAGFRKWNDLIAGTEDQRQAAIAIYKSGIKRICVCRHGMSDHCIPESDAGLPTMADWCQREDCGCEKFRDDRG
jgi:hypothetical protein